MNDHGKPNPVINAVSNAIGALRADADMHDLAQAHEALQPKAIEKLSAEEARRQPTIADAVNRLLTEQGRPTDPQELVPGVTREDIRIATPQGELHAFLYRPPGGQSVVGAGMQAKLPVIVYYHGGGWVIADAAVYDGGARGLAAQAQALVVSVDYRRAPEHPFPAAHDDALATYRWVLDHASELGGDPGRIALAGESAGGNLAVATAVAARSAGLPSPRHVLAVYPVAQTGSLHTESYLENAIAKPLNRAMMEWFMGHVLARPEEAADPRLDLVHADLHGLPPVTLINATLDPLRSDGAMLEDALKAAGVPVEREIYTGVTHEFFGAAAVLEKARQAQAHAARRLRESFA